MWKPKIGGLNHKLHQDFNTRRIVSLSNLSLGFYCPSRSKIVFSLEEQPKAALTYLYWDTYIECLGSAELPKRKRKKKKSGNMLCRCTVVSGARAQPFVRAYCLNSCRCTKASAFFAKICFNLCKRTIFLWYAYFTNSPDILQSFTSSSMPSPHHNKPT